MGFKKNILYLTILIVALAYALFEPLPPEEFTNTGLLYRQLAAMKVIGIMTDISSYLGYNAPVFYRNIVNAIASFDRTPFDPDVTREDTTFNGVRVRIYRPIGAEDTNMRGVMFYHGGGFVIGDIETYDEQVSKITKDIHAVVVSVDYRLAPEYVFPTSVDDCDIATRYFIKNSKKFGVDPKRIAIMGDSAGGNLAAVISLRLRDAGFKPMPQLQVLIYPALQALSPDTPSYKFNQNGPFITRKRSAFFQSVYTYGEKYRKYWDAIYGFNHTTKAMLRSIQRTYMNIDILPKDDVLEHYIKGPRNEIHDNPKLWKEMHKAIMSSDFSPLLARDLSNLPNAYISTCQYDILRDDGFFYAYRLRRENITVVHDNLYACTHGWTFSHSSVEIFMTEFEKILKYMNKNL